MKRAGFAAVLVVTACGGGFDASQFPTPEAVQQHAMTAYRAGDCGTAMPALQHLQAMLPARDERMAEVRYYTAECTLAQGQRLEAARLFRRVADDQSGHRLAAEALLRAGDAYAELWRSPALDPTYGETALATYTELIGRFPNTPAAGRAQLRIMELNEAFAQKDYKNGMFYLRLRAFDSAIIYFKDVVARYPASSLAPQAVLRLVEAYDRIGYEEERDEMCGYLFRYYPNAGQDAERCGGGAPSR